jgi:hypothetical protein
MLPPHDVFTVCTFRKTIQKNPSFFFFFFLHMQQGQNMILFLHSQEYLDKAGIVGILGAGSASETCFSGNVAEHLGILTGIVFICSAPSTYFEK